MAISVSRAPRRTDEHFTKPRTLEGIGPGTYANTFNEPKPPLKEVIAPFNSLQEKVLNPNGGASAFTPGPGAYTPPTTADVNTQSHCSMKSKSAQRGPQTNGSSHYSKPSSDINPGPGAYVVEVSSVSQERKKALKPPVKPVLDVVEKTKPAIPKTRMLPGEAAATEEHDTEWSLIVMRHTGEGSDRPGPGEYNPNDQPLQVSAPSTKFRTSVGSRKLWEHGIDIDNKATPPDIPGPGFYDNGTVPKDELASYNFASRTPMCHQVRTRSDLSVPGPGDYDSVTQIEASMKQAADRSSQLGGKTQFGSVSERIGWSRDVAQPYTDSDHYSVPGPGHYESAARTMFPDRRRKDAADNVLPNSARKKMYGIHHPSTMLALKERQGPSQAFNTSDDRPCNKPIEQSTPAPSDYDLEVARTQSMDADLTERVKVGRKGVFGCCADRFYGSPLHQKENAVGSGGGTMGSGDDTLASGSHSEPRAVFKSGVPRFTDSLNNNGDMIGVKTDKMQTPAPGQYEVGKEPNYRSAFRQPKQDHLSFGGGATRFVPGGGAFHESLGTVNPGPGFYESVHGIDRALQRKVTGSAKISATPKNINIGCTDERIGPGTYGGDLLDTSMLKKTFNVTATKKISATESRRKHAPNSR